MMGHTKTGIKCAVCNKEHEIDDILNMDAINKINSHDKLLAACKSVRSCIVYGGDIDWEAETDKLDQAINSARGVE